MINNFKEKTDCTLNQWETYKDIYMPSLIIFLWAGSLQCELFRKWPCLPARFACQFLPVVGDWATFSSSVTRSNTDSAASMPLFIALWVPFIFGTFINPGLHPIKQPPGKVSLGMDYMVENKMFQLKNLLKYLFQREFLKYNIKLSYKCKF